MKNNIHTQQIVDNIGTFVYDSDNPNFYTSRQIISFNDGIKNNMKNKKTDEKEN